ncbi:MAG TPA: glycosyltransferase family 39 protein [Rhodocyclaceae bacterium]|nr:glycosyltransferase family 39 protein [Rhodocyclaceae bacterium]
MKLRRGSPSARTLLLLLTLFSVLWLGTIDYRKLIMPDEGRYAEIPREMVATGDWLTPRLNGIKYFEKPALQYWATAAAYTLFGEHQWTARLWSALTGLLGVLVTWFTARRLWGQGAALGGAGVLAGSLLYGLIGHVNTLDMGVSFFLSAAVFAFVLAQQDDASDRENRNYMLSAWLALALAMLSKGLIALVLPGTTLLGYSLWQRDFAPWRRLHLIPGLALFTVVAAPWFVAVSLANPEFAWFFFIHEHFQRFLTKVAGRYQPIWYFLPILLVGMVPWLVALFSAPWAAVRRDVSQRFQPRRFLWLWILVVFCFFSVSDSKLASYILPLFPALAALIGWHFEQIAGRDPRALRWHAGPLIPLALACLALSPQAVRLASPEVPVALYAAYVPWLLAASGSLLIGALAGFAFAWRALPRAALLGLATGGLLFSQLILLGHDSLAPSNSSYAIARKIRGLVPPDVPFYSVNTYDQTLPFYLKRTLTMVAYKDELAFGIAHEPQKFVPDLARFAALWRAAPAAWALMTPEGYRQFLAQGLPMQLVARDTRRVIVKNISPPPDPRPKGEGDGCSAAPGAASMPLAGSALGDPKGTSFGARPCGGTKP